LAGNGTYSGANQEESSKATDLHQLEGAHKGSYFVAAIVSERGIAVIAKGRRNDHDRSFGTEQIGHSRMNTLTHDDTRGNPLADKVDLEAELACSVIRSLRRPRTGLSETATIMR
jgi:hypothetical protein